MSSILLTTLVVIANVAGTTMIVPQILSIRRTGRADGVSGSWIGVGLAMNGWWLFYGVANAVWGVVPASAVAFGLYLVTGSHYSRVRGPVGVAAIVRGAVTLGTIPTAVLVGGGWTAAGLAIGLLYAVQFLPAVITALQTDDPSGIAASTWLLAALEAAIWVVYGASVSDAALIVGGTGGTLASLTILGRLAMASTARPVPVDVTA